MVINLKSYRVVLWFFTIMVVALSFPLQVYSGSPYPSLVPYALIMMIFVLVMLRYRHNGIPRKSLFPANYISLVMQLYLLLLVFNTLIQLMLGLISPYDAFSTFTIYFLPVCFYWYFRELATEKEIRSVLIAIVTASLIVGLYFAYDSYVKLSLHQVTDYANKAFEYSKARSGQNAGDLNEARIAVGYRSFGLLENHSVSGGWVVLGAITLLSLIDRRKTLLRSFVIFFYAVLLLLGLNFTAIIAYFCIIFLFEFGGLSVLRLRFSGKLITNMIICIIMLAVLAWIPRFIVGDVMTDFIMNNLLGQKELALGSTGGQDLSMAKIILNNFAGYGRHILEYPHTLLFGDGFSSFGLTKGGDIGFVESMARFGVPFFLVIVYGLWSLTIKAIRRIRYLNAKDVTDPGGIASKLQFAVSVTTLIFISELHYTIWTSKSVLPVVFFVVALYDRLLYKKGADSIISNRLLPV